MYVIYENKQTSKCSIQIVSLFVSSDLAALVILMDAFIDQLNIIIK